MTRGPTLAALVALAALVGCGACGGAKAHAPPPPPPLHLAPVSDLAPAAALTWLVDAKPRALFQDAELATAVGELFPEDRFVSFARRHGDVDLRQLDELVVAAYPDTTLFLAHGVVDPAKVEAAFAARTRALEGRAVDRRADALGTITRSWGTVNDEREQLAVFGRQAVGLEIGRFGPLRASEAFAQEKLRRASPALRAQPLARGDQLFAGSPLRVFAPGPFEGDAKKALGGLLGASTAAAVAVDPIAEGRMKVRVALLGGWSPADADAAGARLAAAINTLASSAIGKLCGLDDPASAPTVSLQGDALVAEMVVRDQPLFRGLHAATGASADEIMRY